MKTIKIPKYVQRDSMEVLENHEQLMCTNHDYVHKSEFDPPPVYIVY